MARLRGRAPKGERLRAAIPHGHWKTTTFVAGLRLDGMVAPMVLDGPINGEAFTAYVKHILVPELSAGDIVVMDNLSSHKGKQIRGLVETKGANLLYICRPTAPTSIQSRTPSPNSRRCSEGLRHAASTACGPHSDDSSTSSRLKNAPTTSLPPATTHRDRKMR